MTNWTLVTGGAKGLGAACCRALAAEGYAIAVHYHKSQREADEVVKECLKQGVRAESIQGDFSTTQSTETFLQDYLKRFPSTETLINNVGNYLIKSALETTIENWISLFQTNLHASFALMKALTPTLIKNKGNIINIGIAGIETFRADTYSTAYTTTKAGLWMLTKSIAKELAAEGVRVNMVSPGYLSNAVDLPDDPKKLPMQRAATLEEVVKVIAFLLDKKNSYVTGQNIEVAGGVRL